VDIAIAPAAPGLFAADSSGRGQGAIINYLENRLGVELLQRAPAARGSVVALFATGEGALSPAVPDGAVTGARTSPVRCCRFGFGSAGRRRRSCTPALLPARWRDCFR
jgi:uncharacterized protein (TIGR03437 family)